MVMIPSKSKMQLIRSTSGASPPKVFLIVVALYSLSFFAHSSMYLHRYSGDEGRALLSHARIGLFDLHFDMADPYFYVTHADDTEKIIFQTIPSQSFITVGYATDSHPPIVDGNYKVNEWTLFETPYQSIRSLDVNSTAIVIHGECWGMVTKATYEMTFTIGTTNAPCDNENNCDHGIPQELSNQLAFKVDVKTVQGSFNRVFLNYWSDAKEDFYGFGTQVDGDRRQ
jgi:hypothetical protein